MSEYIRKSDAVDVIEKEMKNYASDIWYKSAIHSALNDVNEGIKSLEPADVVQVVHAHWYILEYESLTCSRCNGFYYTGCDSTAEAEKRLKEGIYPKYCPNCGAKMYKGGEQDG